ncbi:MAG: hypothetical protein Q9164_004937 [Protoblastenia rupestris]
MALVINDDLMEWNMIDDSASNAKSIKTIGITILSTLSLLIASKHFNKYSPTILNKGPILLSHFLELARGQDDTCPENGSGWPASHIKLSDEHGAEIKGKAGIQQIVKEVSTETEDEEAPSEAELARYERAEKMWTPKGGRNNQGYRVWRHWDWKAEFRTFERTRRVKVWAAGASGEKMGGNFYDLTAKKNKGPSYEEVNALFA